MGKKEFKKRYCCGLPLLWLLGIALRHFGHGDIEAILRFSPWRCPLHFWFGIKCPTCGLGHSLVYACWGQWGHAWSAHILGLPIWIAAWLLWCGLLLSRVPDPA